MAEGGAGVRSHRQGTFQYPGLENRPPPWLRGCPPTQASLGARGCPVFPGADEKGPLGLAGICSALSQVLQKKPRFWGAGGPGGGPHSAAGAPGLPGRPGGKPHGNAECFQAAGF